MTDRLAPGKLPQAILAAIRAHTAFYGYAPDCLDIAHRLRYSPKTIGRACHALARAGQLRQNGQREWVIVEEYHVD